MTQGFRQPLLNHQQGFALVQKAGQINDQQHPKAQQAQGPGIDRGLCLHGRGTAPAQTAGCREPAPISPPGGCADRPSGPLTVFPSFQIYPMPLRVWIKSVAPSSSSSRRRRPTFTVRCFRPQIPPFPKAWSSANPGRRSCPGAPSAPAGCGFRCGSTAPIAPSNSGGVGGGSAPCAPQRGSRRKAIGPAQQRLHLGAQDAQVRRAWPTGRPPPCSWR